ncbi:MAG: hypothetical protein J6D12_07840 [Peptostreptococcaceae bacterium]|nr:hypothetical protein [Peptostreptococcaceae bacterium]
MSELIYNKESVSSYKTNFNTEKSDFSTDAYSTFKNSYFSTCSENLVTKMASILNDKYSTIEKGYTNISTFWDDYDNANDSLESSIESFSASCSNSTVNGYLNSFIGEITDYSNNNNLAVIENLMLYNDVINQKINAYSEKYKINTETLAAIVIVNGSKINSEKDIDLVLDSEKEDIEKYTESLKQKGFPDDYATKLTTLHVYHPNWNFEVSKVGMTLDTAATEETTDYTRNTTQNTEFADGSGRQPESGWYTASKEAVTYYMDPTNFMNEKNIFMFEKLSGNSNITKEQLSTALDGSFMNDSNTYEYNGKKYTYSETFYEAGNKNNVNSIYLTSRVLQEQGKSGSATSSMTGSDGKTYYNYYNFNAYGSTPSEVVQNGLSYAEENGWDNPYKTIDGSAEKIANNYVNNGQDTMYYQKYNVKTGDYDHQYMANIGAPVSESEKSYNVYKNAGMLDSNFNFDIPVYDE